MKLLPAAITRLLGTLAFAGTLATAATQAAAVPVALTNGSGQFTGATGVCRTGWASGHAPSFHLLRE